MQLGYARVVENEVTPAMVATALTLDGSEQGISSIMLNEWNGNPQVLVSPLPGKCVAIVLSKVHGETKCCIYRSDTPIRVELDSDNSLDAVIIGIVP